MSRGFVYTDTDILKIFETQGELTAQELANIMDMSVPTAHRRLHQLRKNGRLSITKELPSENGGPKTKVFGVSGKHRPSIITENGHITINGVDVELEYLPHVISFLTKDHPKITSIGPKALSRLWRSFAFPVMARTVMLLRSREHRTQYLAMRDTLVKEGEELIAFLKGVINDIEETIYSPEFRDPYESNFTNVVEDYHQWGYDHLVEYKPIMFSEAVREAYDSGHIVNEDYE